MIVAITHDLNLAAAYSDRVIVLAEGRLAADGPPRQVITEVLVKQVFDAPVALREGAGGRPWITYG